MTSYLDWHVGMKVVCVDNRGATEHLRSGEIYTVNSIEPEFVGLAEQSTWTTEFHGDPAWFRSRFRPVQPRATDISIFTAILTDTKQKVPV